MSALAARLQPHVSRLTRRVLDEMYQNAFWQARYGERGRRMAEQDGHYHLSYVIQALDAGDPFVFVHYTRWLQTLLVSRGMCSRHIEENFERLERAVSSEIPDAEEAANVLRAGREALLYHDGAARELQRSAGLLADATVAALQGEFPHWAVCQGDGSPLRAEVLDHVSYLADALAAQRPELFYAHERWMRDFSRSKKELPEQLPATLSALARSVSTQPSFPEELTRSAGDLLKHALIIAPDEAEAPPSRGASP